MDERCATQTYEQLIIERKRMARAQFKQDIYMFLHKVFWRTMYFIKLAGPYSRMACKLNFYRKYMDGRCMWCGVKH